MTLSHLIELAFSGLLGWNLAFLSLELVESRPRRRAWGPNPRPQPVVTIEPLGSDPGAGYPTAVECRQPAE